MIPFSTLSERVDFLFRIGIVYGVLSCFFLLGLASLPHPFSGLVKIPLMLIAIYYWSIYRPTLIPIVLVFTAGLLTDLLLAGPLGFSALIYVVLQWLVVDQRSFLLGQSFLVVWFIFTMINAAIVALKWFIAGLMNMQWGVLSDVLPDMLLGVVAFPVVYIILHLSHKMLPDPRMPLTSQGKSSRF